MAPASRCPKCDLYLSPIRPHACLLDRINEALEGVDTTGIDRHERMVRWLAGWEPELVTWFLAVVEAARAAEREGRVMATTAELIEAVGPDNLPALLRVAWIAGPYYDDGRSFPRKLADQDAACDAVDDDTWDRLGEALGGAS